MMINRRWTTHNKMKKYLRTIATLLAFLLPGILSAEQFTLTIAKANELAVALTDLGTPHDRLIDQGSGQPQKVVSLPYDFGDESIRVSMIIARDLAALRPALEAFEKDRAALIKELWGDATPKPEDAQQAIFKSRIAPKADSPFTVDLTKLLESDLNLKQNRIASTTITSLLPLLVAPPVVKK